MSLEEIGWENFGHGGAPLSFIRPQCCPMDTYDTDSGGNLQPTCECDDECTCMCPGCRCENWGEEEDW
jgi:hypothetical protein